MYLYLILNLLCMFLVFLQKLFLFVFGCVLCPRLFSHHVFSIEFLLELPWQLTLSSVFIN